MDLGLGGRTALVLGASSGIGLGVARALAAEGARVALVARSAESLEAAAAQTGGETTAIVADTSDLERMAEIGAEAEAALGPVDVLVTNTGGPPPGAALDNDAGEWRDAYTSLVLAPRAVIESVLPGMRSRGFGRIVNVASTSVIEPIAGLTLSNANRMAALGFLKTLAREVAGEGVTVNTVATGRFATERLAKLYGSMEEAERIAAEEVPAGRLGTPEEYGALVAFLASERAGYLTGATIPLDGGLLRSV